MAKERRTNYHNTNFNALKAENIFLKIIFQIIYSCISPAMIIPQIYLSSPKLYQLPYSA